MKRSFRTCAPVSAMVYAWMLSSSAVLAGSVTPLHVELEAMGTKKASTIQYKNNSARPLAIEMRIFRLTMDENGNHTSERVQDSFSIFPPLATIDAGKTQSIRLQWAGNPTPPKSESYLFSLREIPVKFPDRESGLALVTDFSVVVNVAPVGSVGSLSIVSAGIGRDEGGVLRPQIIVENKGNRHVNLSDAAVTFTNGGWSATLTASRIRQLIGVGVVQPGKKRRFLFPVDGVPQTGTVTARIDYQPLVTSSTSQ